jgi:hypothetical protein
MICPKCGSNNYDWVTQCGRCGSALLQQAVDETHKSIAEGQTKPPTSRTAALPKLSEFNDLRRYLEQHFSPQEWKHNFFLTPRELCEVAENYASEITIDWYSEGQRLTAESCVLVCIGWKSNPGKRIVLVGLWVFPNSQEAYRVWIDKGVYGKTVPVDQILDIQGRYVLNFASGSYALNVFDLQSIDPYELRQYMLVYCDINGIVIDL